VPTFSPEQRLKKVSEKLLTAGKEETIKQLLSARGDLQG
jgi:hypothetical protein